jgi:thiamine-phosphate pyrophosphorylase
MPTCLVLPRLYVIVDAQQSPLPEMEMAERLLRAGVRLFQYRDKNAPAREMMQTARELAGRLRPEGAALIVNDRPDVAYLAGASGVHVGQEDLGVDEARSVAGPGKWVGVSTHNADQFRAAAQTSADYIALGPIFATVSKERTDPVVGKELLKQVRPLTSKPIVAIGGITLDRAREVIEAGADSVAVISGILQARDPGERARQYLDVLETARPSAE